MATESLLVLAAQMVVDAVAGDEWDTVQRSYVQLLGRGDAKLTWLTERSLKETREQLIGANGTDRRLIRGTGGGVGRVAGGPAGGKTLTLRLNCRTWLRRSRRYHPLRRHLRPTTRSPPVAP